MVVDRVRFPMTIWEGNMDWLTYFGFLKKNAKNVPPEFALKKCPSCHAFQSATKEVCPNCSFDLSDTESIAASPQEKGDKPSRWLIGLHLFGGFCLMALSPCLDR